MARDKPLKLKGVPNKHLHARTTFLYHAATYLTLQASPIPKTADAVVYSDAMSQPSKTFHRGYHGLALQLGTDLQTVSRKGQVRLSAELKRSVCKGCNTILVPGRTAVQRIENHSRGKKKPWADVLVIECMLCASKKRYPTGAKRQKRKMERDDTILKGIKVTDADEVDQTTNSAIPTSTSHSSKSGG